MACPVLKGTTAEGEEFTAIVCARGNRVQRCRWCHKDCSKLCDFPVGKGTCDKAMCDDHATKVGEDRDYCPLHSQQGTLPLEDTA